MLDVRIVRLLKSRTNELAVEIVAVGRIMMACLKPLWCFDHCMHCYLYSTHRSGIDVHHNIFK
jgi:hypothetical protein